MGDACAQTLGGDGTVGGSWAASCQSQVQGRGYARYYTFTLGQESQITIDLISSVDPYLFLRQGDSRSGAVLHENDDIENGVNLNSRITATLAAGSYTIEATTFATGQSGTFTLTVVGLGGTTGQPPATGDVCGETLDSDGTVNGSWAEGCQSQVQGRGYARYYTFTLAEQSPVTIELASTVDTYLYVRAGEARSGDALHFNDDIESSVILDSRISATLEAGTYTIEPPPTPLGRRGHSPSPWTGLAS